MEYEEPQMGGMVETNGNGRDTNGNGRDTNGMQPDHVTCDLIETTHALLQLYGEGRGERGVESVRQEPLEECVYFLAKNLWRSMKLCTIPSESDLFMG